MVNILIRTVQKISVIHVHFMLQSSSENVHVIFIWETLLNCYICYIHVYVCMFDAIKHELTSIYA